MKEIDPVGGCTPAAPPGSANGLIKWAPMHKQVTLFRKLLSHIFEHYAEVQDDSYISDEDIEQYPEILCQDHA